MKRTYVRLKLRMDSSWRVGSWDSQAADVVGTLTDATNRPIVPGSGIAGGLRQAAGENKKALFGPEPGADQLAASPWWLLGTVVGDAEVNERQRTRIDRVRKSAAERGLFRTEEVSGGDDVNTVTIYLRREHDAAQVQAEVIDPLVAVLRTWQPQIGGGRSVGMGQASITKMKHRTIDLDDENDLLELLELAESPIQRVDTLLKKGTPASGLTASRTPYLKADVKIDFLAVTAKSTDRINGSTWKGLLRSRIEFIGRSLGYAVCGAREADTSDWSGCGTCAVCHVFGSKTKPGIWQFNDSKWSPATSDSWQERKRTAIDRFTGGVRDGALWDQQYVSNVSINLVINGRAPTGSDEWVGAALLHAIRDLNDGLIAVGPEGAAGFGTAKISKLKLADEPVDLATIAAVPLPSEELSA